MSVITFYHFTVVVCTQHKACMIEAFRHDAGSVYHIVKRCLAECPAFVNGSAEHTRCCAKEACNDVISIGNSRITRRLLIFCQIEEN